MSVGKSNSPSTEFPTVFTATSAQFPNLLGDAATKIKTRDFLNASSRIVVILEKLGKTFAPIIYDINGNIIKITNKYDEDRHTYEFLEDLILIQKNADEGNVLDSLQWLRRALHFISRFFSGLIEDADSRRNTNDLTPFIKTAYQETLQRYHGWLTTQIFCILSRLTPSKQHLFYVFALEKHNQHNQVIRDMRIFNQGMASCVQRLADLYREHDLETNYRV